jgi:zinc transport system substrate-binding protein
MKPLIACESQLLDMKIYQLLIRQFARLLRGQLTRRLKPTRCVLSCQCTIAFIILIHPYAVHASNTQLTIITDIAPVHSLTSMIMGETGTPHLLVPPTQSPHHFSLKPSQAQLLSSAHLAIFIDDEFTPPLTRQMNATNNDITRLELNSILTGLSSADMVEADMGEHHKHDDTLHNKEHNEVNQHDDLHTWLNPNNAIVWLQHIAQTLSELDPDNTDTYNRNAQHAITQLNVLNENLTQLLQGVRNEPYLVYHDAYQHFAAAFKLTKAESIAISDARKPGARRLSAMRKKARTVTCVFAENQHSDALVNTVTVGLDVKRGELDPIGSNLDRGPDLYIELLTQLAESFNACLSKK